MQKNDTPRKRRLRSGLTAALPLVLMSLAGCGGSSSSNTDPAPVSRTGTFGSSAVSGLHYRTGNTATATTDARGRFRYTGNQNVTFSIGELVLGEAPGAHKVTVLSVSGDALSASEPHVTNKLILLQTLDADGDLNNGIQLTEQIREAISANAGDLSFDQPTADFTATLQNVVTDLENAGAFSDTDPRARSLTNAGDALEQFDRANSRRRIVDTADGRLSGFEADENTWQFLGIPYAQPPLGDLRWRAPQPVAPWDEVRDATAWSDQAAQNAALERFGEGGMSEDSLYLNVTAPKDAEGLPVMVWFHGGGFTALTSNTKPFNNPKAVASKGVVQVSVNHRLGPFGYIAHPGLSAESGYGGSGNYGQMDLIAALEWVRENIAAFGGDPNNVTLFGESGGGRKVLSLMASPQAAGLFHRAISQSGTLIPDTRSLADAEAIGSQLQTNLGAASVTEMQSSAAAL